jgi:hypothetical protein
MCLEWGIPEISEIRMYLNNQHREPTNIIFDTLPSVTRKNNNNKR